MELTSPCSPGSQAGSILPLASLREGFEQPQQRTSQNLPTEQLGWERKPAAPSRNSPAQRLSSGAEDMRTDINRALPALQEKKEEITGKGGQKEKVRKRKKHRNLKKEEEFYFSGYTGMCRDCFGANSVSSAYTGSVQGQVAKLP